MGGLWSKNQDCGKISFWYPRKNRVRATICNDVIYDS